MLGKDYDGQDCAIARALEVLGERWTLLIVRDAFFGVRRFSDFLVHLDIPRAVLSDRLKGLVANGVLARRPDPDRPGRDVYELTEAGRALWPVVYALRAWGHHHRGGTVSRRVFTHVGCGAQLDEAGACRCSPRPAPEEIEMSLQGGASGRSDPVSVALNRPHRLLAPIDPPTVQAGAA